MATAPCCHPARSASMAARSRCSAAGVITQYGVYSGPAVDVVTVAATVGKDASIQAELGGKMLLVDSASFALSAGGRSAHLAGTSNRNADIANTPVTVDITC